MSALGVYYEINMLLTCILTLFFQPLLLESRPMTSHYMTYHVIMVIYLFIVQKKTKTEIKKKKKKIKENKEK